MSDYQFEVGKEYKTRAGYRCVILADDEDCGLVWKFQTVEDGKWVVCSSLSLANPMIHACRPVPPDRTVDQLHKYDDSGCVVRYVDKAESAVPVRWTIGSDGKPAYAVRLDDDGEPMYEVTRRGERR